MEVRHPHHTLIDIALWILVVVMALVVLYTSVSMPGDGTVTPLSDKLLHYLAYTGLTMSLLLAAVWAPIRGEGRFPKMAVPALLLTSLFGVAIEVVQGPIPGRDAQLLDALANALGAVTALGLWLAWRVAALSSRRGT